MSTPQINPQLQQVSASKKTAICLAAAIAGLLASACAAAPHSLTKPSPTTQGKTMQTPQAPYPLAPGYQPGKPTYLEKTLEQSPYSADEAVRRTLQLIVETSSAEDLTLERVARTYGVTFKPLAEGETNGRIKQFWLTPNWLWSVIYTPPNPIRQFDKYLELDFSNDPEHWIGFPERDSLCANRAMDVAAVEKVLLAHGFFMTREPVDQFTSWSYFNGKHVSVDLTSFGDGLLPSSKDVCIRSISLLPGEAK